jgi:hypothetical protein
MKIPRTLCAILLLIAAAAPIQGDESASGKGLQDSLLDQLIGDWNVDRKMANGRTERNLVHGEWVLQHQFVELHYRDVASPPHYEAVVLITYDSIGNRYLCHWADTTGGSYSTDGFAPRDQASNAMEFKFAFHDGQLTNRYAFDPQSHVWTSTIRQEEKGEWKLFCEDKFVPAGAK